MSWSAVLGVLVVGLGALAAPPARASGGFRIPKPPPPSTAIIKRFPGETAEQEKARRQQEASAYKAWYAALTPAQRRWFERHCRSEDNAYDEYCQGTPLVAVFGAGAVELGDAKAVPFGSAPALEVAWPTPATPWLVRDVNGNGRVD
jgi:hypothetical protein